MQVASSTVPTTALTDRECLEASRRNRSAENLRPLLERYLAFVYSSAHRRTGSADHATEVTRAVFLVLGRRARKLPKKIVLAGWLFHVTRVACKKVKRLGFWDWPWPRRKPGDAAALDAPLWTRVSP